MGVRGIRRKGASPIKLNAEAMLDYASHNDLIINNQLDIDRLIKDYNITIRKAPCHLKYQVNWKKRGNNGQ